ncbi:MAG: Arc family DNA-binding protein [Steroidobacteraceae bacterium]
MAVNLSIKSVPDDLAARLRMRAERNHRSLQGELMAIIERAASEGDASAGEPEAANPSRRSLVGTRRGTLTIEQIAAEHRLLYPEPFADLPRAVDILRADRDAR